MDPQPSVAIVIACHVEEARVDATVASVSDSRARIVVCINGPAAATSRAARALDGGDVEILTIDLASKPAAWTELRQVDAEILVFCDADVIVEPGSVRALVDALIADPSLVIAAAGQQPEPPASLAGRVATVPFRLAWGGIAGTLYAARRQALPEEMPAVLLDDAWLAAVVGPHRVRRVTSALARFTPPATWRDLWRQRVRAEAGKRQLRAMGLSLAAAPDDLSPVGVARSYRVREWPLVAILAAIKAAAALRARFIARPAWVPASSTK